MGATAPTHEFPLFTLPLKAIYIPRSYFWLDVESSLTVISTSIVSPEPVQVEFGGTPTALTTVVTTSFAEHEFRLVGHVTGVRTVGGFAGVIVGVIVGVVVEVVVGVLVAVWANAGPMSNRKIARASRDTVSLFMGITAGLTDSSVFGFVPPGGPYSRLTIVRIGWFLNKPKDGFGLTSFSCRKPGLAIVHPFLIPRPSLPQCPKPSPPWGLGP